MSPVLVSQKATDEVVFDMAKNTKFLEEQNHYFSAIKRCESEKRHEQ